MESQKRTISDTYNGWCPVCDKLADGADLVSFHRRLITHEEIRHIELNNDFELEEGMAVCVLIDLNRDTYEAVIVSLNDDNSVTVRSEMTGKRYTVDKKYILPVK